MSMDIWKDVAEFEGYYQISNSGRIKRIAAKSGTQAGRILKDFNNGKGYRYITLRKNDVPKNHYIHILVAKAFIPNPDNKPMVNHIDGNKSNNKLSNLEWCDGKENMQHASRLGLLPKGEISKFSRLTKKQVLLIRELDKRGYSRDEIVKQVQTSKGNLCRIIKRQLWAHI